MCNTSHITRDIRRSLESSCHWKPYVGPQAHLDDLSRTQVHCHRAWICAPQSVAPIIEDVNIG